MRETKYEAKRHVQLTLACAIIWTVAVICTCSTNAPTSVTPWLCGLQGACAGLWWVNYVKRNNEYKEEFGDE